MKGKIMFLVCGWILVGACSAHPVLQEADLQTSVETAKAVMYQPVPLAQAKQAVPFSFQTPSFLPYAYVREIQAVIRKEEGKKQQHLVVNIKYDRPDGKQNGYMELTVANFNYSMQLIEQQLFDEVVTLSDGTKAYYKGASDGGNEFAALTWKQQEIDYQLLYRHVQGRDGNTVKQELLQAAGSMRE